METPQNVTHITPTERRQAVLTRVAGHVCGDRQNAYGDADVNLARIAEQWNWWLKNRGIIFGGHAGLSRLDVCQMMNMVKACRMLHDIHHQDNWEDTVGYSAIGAAIAEVEREELLRNLKQYRENGGQ